MNMESKNESRAYKNHKRHIPSFTRQAGVEQKDADGRPALSLSALAFWRRKSEANNESESKPPESLRVESFSRLVPPTEAQQAREELKLLEVERQILGLALTTVYESQTKGLLTNKERDYLLGKYKTELKRLEERITEKQRIVDLYELEESREKIIQSLKQKLAEIDSKIEKLRPEFALTIGGAISPLMETEVLPEVEEKPARIVETSGTSDMIQNPEKQEKKEEPKSKVEKRLEAIREEVLKAMERLEQIEAEG